MTGKINLADKFALFVLNTSHVTDAAFTAPRNVRIERAAARLGAAHPLRLE